MDFIKNAIRRIIPEAARRRAGYFFKVRVLGDWRLFRTFTADYRRYRRYSSKGFDQTDELENLSSMIIMEAHALEKGFSLPEIRPGYGVERIRKLIGLMRRYQTCGYDCNGLAMRKAQSVLAEYIRYHDQIGFDLGARRDEILPWVDMACTIGGYIRLNRDNLLEQSTGDFRACALSRCSIRDYTPEPVPLETIREAVSIARKTPSVCNRQPWHVYIIKNQELKRGVLELQNGNRGFGSKADFLAIVTADIRGFVGPGERHEAYVDGGLFSMSLMYAFHYMGIGACPLNWMVEPPVDRKLRNLLSIGASENVIMIITAGNLPGEVRVAKSVRKEADDVMTVME